MKRMIQFAGLILMLCNLACKKSPPVDYSHSCDQFQVKLMLDGQWLHSDGKTHLKIFFYTFHPSGENPDTGICTFDYDRLRSTERRLQIVLLRHRAKNDSSICVWEVKLGDRYNYWIVYNLTEDVVELAGEPDKFDGRYQRIK